MKHKKTSLTILLLTFFCSCTGNRDLNRELELLEIERIQLMNKQKPMNTDTSYELIPSELLFFPKQDSQLMLFQLEKRNKNLYEESLFEQQY